MDAIEKRARERARFDAWVKASGSYSWNGFNRMEDMWDAWQAALTPPEGYVLVQETQLRHLLSDAITSVDFIAGRGQSKPLARRVSDQAWALVELVPARRKVP
ncbi:hypothetical protein K7569_10820 [Stenotrophomonas maltophilia]|nr:hypothetical protein K7569_10820 [Stenotrophomonas maltophilia]